MPTESYAASTAATRSAMSGKTWCRFVMLSTSVFRASAKVALSVSYGVAGSRVALAARVTRRAVRMRSVGCVT